MAGFHAQGAQASESPEVELESWTPLSVIKGVIVVHCTVNGEGALGIIDTGATCTLVDHSHQPPAIWAHRVRIGADTGSTTVERGRAIKVSIGEICVTLPSPLITGLGFLGETTGVKIDIVIGQDFLSNLITAIYFSSGRIAFLKKPPEANAGWNRLDLRGGPAGRLCVEVVLEESRPTLAVLDLGSSNALMVSAAFAQANHLLVQRRVSSAATATVSGTKIGLVTSIDGITIAGVRVLSVPVDVFDCWSEPEVPVNVGLPILQRFDLILDIAGVQLWLCPRSEALATAFDRDMSGLGLAFRGDRLVVVHVGDDSPAAAAGFEKGDVITHVDGMPVNVDYQTSKLSDWRFGPAGRAVVVSGPVVGARRLILGDYY